jgi:hypothetical protein
MRLTNDLLVLLDEGRARVSADARQGAVLLQVVTSYPDAKTAYDLIVEYTDANAERLGRRRSEDPAAHLDAIPKAAAELAGMRQGGMVAWWHGVGARQSDSMCVFRSWA